MTGSEAGAPGCGTAAAESPATSDFEYELPNDLVARYPAERRDDSRLLLVRRDPAVGPELEDLRFPGLVRLIPSGDALVLNDTRVFPARSRAYLRHLFAMDELLGLRLLSLHNVSFLVDLTSRAREAILRGEFEAWAQRWLDRHGAGEI